MALHAFVAMPFGTKEGIDFNKVYDEYIKPALSIAGFEVFRADEEQRAGNIRTDMFQELLLADLVVVDLSIDNPNVWYELGVRHGLRSRGVIQLMIAGKREKNPFDICVDRTLHYHIKDGAPDPVHRDKDQEALATFATETIQSWHGRKVSPVYHLLRYLQEPDWKTLKIDEAREFWEAYEDWERRVEVARKGQRPGDILVFATETPTQMLRLEACRKAGRALLSLGHYGFALAQYEDALAMDPTDVVSRQQKGLLLGRLKKFDEAKEWLKALVEDHPDDAESLGLLGRIEKETWMHHWRKPDQSLEGLRAEALAEEGMLQEAIDAYLQGFQKDPRNYYPGVNALTLLSLQRHLVDTAAQTDEYLALEGGVRWAVHSALSKDDKDYWARVTLGDIEVLSGDKARIEQCYRAAVAVAEKNWFALDSSRQQLLILKDLGFRPLEVEAALKIFDRELQRLERPEGQWTPQQVFLFSGHMIDAPGREPPRFPAEKEPLAAQAIAACLEKLQASPNDLALCGGACGGDLLFAEACLARGLRLELRLPLEEPEFLAASVTFPTDGERWRARFYAVKNNPLTRLLIMPEALGPPPTGVNVFARNNLWQLYTALAWEPEKIRFLCLWNGKGGDGPGGTHHMHETVKKHSGQVYPLKTTDLW